jgi:hypothetical protein
MVRMPGEALYRAPEIAHEPSLPAQGYRLRIEADRVRIDSADDAGTFYGRATLTQLRGVYGENLPLLLVEDWPDLAVRGVMLDVSRDKVPTLDTLKALIDRLASWKINHLELYTEQVAGYYDPDSATLFGVSGADPAQLRVVVAHEMVHALQGERIPLDSILHDKSNNDRLAAAQSVLEGQATLAGMKALFPPEIDPTRDPDFWTQYAEQVRGGQASMPVLASAPLVVREALIFPYLAGAQFMHWWESSPFRDSVPYGPRMPVSTEQVLFPERYARRDVPISIQFPADSGVMYEDVLGESEVRILMARLRGSEEVTTLGPIGWGGDRYRVYRTPAGPALVWYMVWDDRASAERFAAEYAGRLQQTGRKDYRATLESPELDGKPAIRYILAPESWNRWSELPRVIIAR